MYVNWPFYVHELVNFGARRHRSKLRTIKSRASIKNPHVFSPIKETVYVFPPKLIFCKKNYTAAIKKKLWKQICFEKRNFLGQLDIYFAVNKNSETATKS